MSLVIDATVSVSDSRPDDVNHAVSADFFERVRGASEPIHEPSLLLPECAGAIARATRNRRLGAAAVAIIGVTSNLVLYDLNNTRSRHAAQMAADQLVRGADAVYVQLAAELGATLITWDTEMLVRAPAVVQTMSPAQWLAANPPLPTPNT